MKDDSQFRRVQLTINNPTEHGFDHARLKEELGKLKSCTYWIMCDEIGGKDGTEHTHVYGVFKSPVRYNTIKRRFPPAHIEKPVASHQSNIDYVTKTGKWTNSDKGATSLPNTLEEWGERPIDSQGTDEKLRILYQLIKDGYSNFEILEKCSDYLFDIDKIDRVRLLLKQEEYKTTWRSLEVTYIYGKTGLGKSRYVMDKYGYENVFRITDARNPWDTYVAQDVVVYEEFASSYSIQRMLNYLDGYPLKLEARYCDKQACFTKVYIISNIPLDEQYPNVRDEHHDVWLAFMRRITKVMWFKSKDEIITYDSSEAYLHRNEKFHELSVDEEKDLPF